MKNIRVFSNLIVGLLALCSAPWLRAQSLVVDKTSLTFAGQFGGSAITQTLNITSSTGAATNFTLSYPNYPWLKVNGLPFGVGGITPAAVTVTADPTGLAVGTYNGSITVTGGSATNNSIPVTLTVSAIGVSPASLALTYTFGSNTFPANPVLTLNSAVSTACTAVATPTSGGNWFNLLQNGCGSPGSLTVLLNTFAIAGLTQNNTYSGTITITPSPAGQSPSIVVPVALTVLPTPPVTINPSSLALNYQTGVAAANPSATFTIATTAGQSVGYTITQSGTLAGISTITPATNGATDAPSGTATLTYTVTSPATLALGTHTSKLTVFTPGGSPTQQDIGITLLVSNTPLLTVPNATLNFTSQAGGTPADQTVNITSTGTPLSYAVFQSANSAWLSVPNAGTTATPLTVSVNPAGLTPGSYSATVTVRSATPNSPDQTFLVVLKVTNDAAISASLSSLSFPYQIGQPTPVAQSVKLTSSTGDPLNYTATLATTTCGSAWLLLNGATNNVTGVTPPSDTLTVSVATAGLTAAATCTGAITINATNPRTNAAAVGSPLTIQVTLFVSTTAQLVLTPATIQPFTMAAGGQLPAPQVITLTSTNNDVLNYQVSIQPQNSWLSVNTSGGTTAANNVLTISATPIGTPAGKYNGTVTVTATGPGGATVADSPVVIPVTLIVTGGSLTVSATDLNFAQVQGGPAPASQTVNIGSIGQSLNYTAVANSNNAVNWLSVSPANGNTSTSGTLSVTVDGSKLTAGNLYNGFITVTSPAAGNSPATINVHFKVDSGTLTVPTTTLTFTQAAGGAAPAAQSIAVTGTPVPLNFSVATTAQNNGNWLTATPASGTTPGSVQVQIVNSGTLAVGSYSGKVTLTSPGATNSPIDVPVVLNVVAAAVLSASPTSLNFTFVAGQGAAAAQNLAIAATGTAVPFTVQAQADGSVGQWLLVSPTSGVAPATLQVSVASSTPPGIYSGRIVVTSASALTPLTIPVSLTVTAIPKPVFTSVANAANYAKDAISPGENVAIFGTGVGPDTPLIATVTNNAFPTTLGNTRVLFDGTPAPITYASSGQTSVMVPYGVGGRPTTSIVVEYFGVQSAPLTYNVVAAAPGIYTQNSQGTGPGAILNQDFTLNGPNTPEKRGNVIAIYMTGEGQTNPQGVDGAVIPAVLSALKKPVLPVTVTIGGVEALVTYAGSAPGSISGFAQVNAIIPANAPTGTQAVVVSVGTFKSQSGASAATVAIAQ
ncbi:MAG: hypothetical protein ABI759_30605 [Candidatus Solibacter sp.]